MTGFRITLELYARSAWRAGRATLASPVILLLFPVYAIVLRGLLPILAPLGMAGGFILGALWAACLSSFLAAIGDVVRTGRLTFDDVARGYARHWFDVLGFLFAWWIFGMVLTPVVYSLPQGPVVYLAVQLVLFTILNAVPELIEKGAGNVLELVAESYRFIAENWIEWFPPTILLGAILILFTSVPVGGLASWLWLAVLSGVTSFAMVFRAFLFDELHGSTRRSRAFRFRAR